MQNAHVKGRKEKKTCKGSGLSDFRMLACNLCESQAIRLKIFLIQFLKELVFFLFFKRNLKRFSFNFHGQINFNSFFQFIFNFSSIILLSKLS